MLEVDKLPALIHRERYTQTYRTEISLWDSGWLVLLLVLLMGGEWIVRRRYDLP